MLDLSENFLRELPESVCRLQKLERLVLSHNRLKSLPDVSKPGETYW